ncbi:hypothetical protein PR048_030485 [Dryococelus australis]|uniref:Uncharacterized protein n=1 Tax=Dryococelus australis TaxID=614101 RepID=A0ABQ9G951_9NEOP|nr:hypothetical protein PR048_030485 [Dryococelus australis]
MYIDVGAICMTDVFGAAFRCAALWSHVLRGRCGFRSAPPGALEQQVRALPFPLHLLSHAVARTPGSNGPRAAPARPRQIKINAITMGARASGGRGGTVAPLRHVSPGSALRKGVRALIEKQSTELPSLNSEVDELMRLIAAPEWKGGGKWEIYEKTHRPAGSFGTIPKCENPGATPPTGNRTRFSWVGGKVEFESAYFTVNSHYTKGTVTPLSFCILNYSVIAPCGGPQWTVAHEPARHMRPAAILLRGVCLQLKPLTPHLVRVGTFLISVTQDVSPTLCSNDKRHCKDKSVLPRHCVDHITEQANIQSHGGVAIRLLVFHVGSPLSSPGRVAPGFSHVGIVPDDVAGRRVFSGISPFPPPLHSHLTSSSSAKFSTPRRYEMVWRFFLCGRTESLIGLREAL